MEELMSILLLSSIIIWLLYDNSKLTFKNSYLEEKIKQHETRYTL
jgi:hypothetical protein